MGHRYGTCQLLPTLSSQLCVVLCCVVFTCDYSPVLTDWTVLMPTRVTPLLCAVCPSPFFPVKGWGSKHTKGPSPRDSQKNGKGDRGGALQSATDRQAEQEEVCVSQLLG